MKPVAIPLDETLEAYVAAQVESGAFRDVGDYIRSLVAMDRDRGQRLRDAIQEGLDSGISDRSIMEIFEDVRRRHLETRP